LGGGGGACPRSRGGGGVSAWCGRPEWKSLPLACRKRFAPRGLARGGRKTRKEKVTAEELKS